MEVGSQLENLPLLDFFRVSQFRAKILVYGLKILAILDKIQCYGPSGLLLGSFFCRNLINFSHPIGRRLKIVFFRKSESFCSDKTFVVEKYIPAHSEPSFNCSVIKYWGCLLQKPTNLFKNRTKLDSRWLGPAKSLSVWGPPVLIWVLQPLPRGGGQSHRLKLRKYILVLFFYSSGPSISKKFDSCFSRLRIFFDDPELLFVTMSISWTLFSHTSGAKTFLEPRDFFYDFANLQKQDGQL